MKSLFAPVYPVRPWSNPKLGHNVASKANDGIKSVFTEKSPKYSKIAIPVWPWKYPEWTQKLGIGFGLVRQGWGL